MILCTRFANRVADTTGVRTLSSRHTIQQEAGAPVALEVDMSNDVLAVL